MFNFNVLWPAGILLACLLGVNQVSQAQTMQLVPLESNPVIQTYLEEHPNHSRSNQVCPLDTLSLPFFDDFSRGNSIYPNCQNWLDNQVFVNSDMAFDPPSVGTATFDGLRFDGIPYNIGAQPGLGLPADTLTSQPIDLSGKTLADGIYLSFFYQKQGLCDRPEVRDSFILEFKDNNQDWFIVWESGGVPNNVSSLTLLPFEQQFLALSAPFFHADFQFRFRNLASITGSNDHWHLDYVLLDENRFNNADTLHPTFGRYPDVAWTHRPNTLLKNNYTAMPWRHFDNSTAWDSLLILRNYNHNAAQTATLDRLCTLSEIDPNSNLLLTEGIPAVGAYTPSPNVDDSLNHQLINSIGTINPTGPTVLETTYTILNPTGFQSNPIYYQNDTVSTKTILQDYFAYDDGTAETRVIAQGLGTKIAVRFESEIRDTIQGVYMHMPYFDRDAQSSLINIKVWVDSLSDNTEVFSKDLQRLQYTPGFNGFYYVNFEDFTGAKFYIPIEAGRTFYVGWQQSFGPEVPIGFDRSTNNKDKTFVGVGASWTPAVIDGTVMLRPVLSPDSLYVSVEKIEAVPTANLSVFPNPTRNLLNFNLNIDGSDVAGMNSDYHLEVYSAMGQLMHQGNLVPQLDVRTWAAGLYVVMLRDDKGQLITQEKIIKQ